MKLKNLVFSVLGVLGLSACGTNNPPTPPGPGEDSYYACIVNNGTPIRLDENLEIADVELTVGNNVSFIYFNGTQTIQLNTLTIEGSNTYGFGLNDGKLNSILDGTFSFKLNGDASPSSITILGEVDAKYAGYVNISVLPEPLISPFAFIEVDNGSIVYETETADIPAAPGTITLEVKDGETSKPITLLDSAANDDFELSDDHKVLTYIAAADNSYSFTIKESIVTGDLSMYIDKKSSPIPMDETFLYTSKDDFGVGTLMVEKTPGEPIYIAENISFSPGDKAKVLFNDSLINTYINEGNKNALGDHVAKIDDEGFIEFLFDGVYSISFNNEAGNNYGVTVIRESITCPYVGYADLVIPQFEVHESRAFFFRSFDVGENTVEYYLSNCPAAQTMNYTIKNGEIIVDFIFDSTSGEGPNFTLGDSVLTYNGTSSALNFYIKENLTTHEINVKVETYVS